MGVFNTPAILAAVRAAEVAALEEVAAFVVRDAKARAPVRKVFKEGGGFRRKFRRLTSPEKALAIRRVMAYGAYSDFQKRRVASHITHYGRAEIRRPGSANSLARSRQLRVLGFSRGGQFTPRVDAVRSGRGYLSASLEPLLSSRGKYEVKSGRGIFNQVTDAGERTRVQVGGRLKASIADEGVTQTDAGATVKVAARVRYAKFVEFPTTHNAAQPFLLPALHGARGRLRNALARELRERLG